MAEKFYYISKFSIITIFIGIFAIFIYSHTKDIALLFNNISVLFTDFFKAIGLIKEVAPEPEPVVEIIIPQEKPKEEGTSTIKIICYCTVGVLLVGSGAGLIYCVGAGVALPIIGEITFQYFA